MFKLTPCLLDLEPRKKKTTSPDRKPGRIAAVTREYARVNARVRIRGRIQGCCLTTAQQPP